eukprot:tig00000237_g20460.t1
MAGTSSDPTRTGDARDQDDADLDEGEYLADEDVIEEVELDNMGVEMEDADDDALGAIDENAVDEGGDQELVDVKDESAAQFREHKDPVYCVALHPSNPELAASGGGDDVAYVWNIATGQALHRLQGHTDTVANLKFSFDGKLVATAGMDGTAKVWNVETGALNCTLEGPAADLTWVDWHPKGYVLLGGSEDGTVWMWNAPTTKCMQVFAGHSGPVTCGGFTPDGKTVVTGSADGTVRTWSPRDGSGIGALGGRGFHEGPIDGAKVRGALAGHGAGIEDVGFCSSLPLAASCSLDSTLRVWDLTTMALRQTCEHGEGNQVLRLAWHESQPFVYTAATDGVLRVWDARNGQCVRSLSGHRDSILSLAVSRDGNTIVTGSDDHSALVFRLA